MYFSDIEAFRGLFPLSLCDVMWCDAMDQLVPMPPYHVLPQHKQLYD